jgi:hypothetical protein
MAVEISNGTTVPHATGHADLLDKLKIFALANAWTALEDTSDKLVLQGEGSGTDEIIVAIQKYANVGADSYGWKLNGYTGYQSGLTFYNQPGAFSTTQIGGAGAIALPLWDGEIPYWFVVSGRRIIIIAKVSTTYQACYLGFYLPYASPNQYPYPLAIGGAYVGNASQTTPRWSNTGGTASNFWTWLNGAGVSSMMVRLPGGSWYSDVNNITSFSTGIFPYNQADAGLMRQALDDSPILTKTEIQQYTGTPSVYHNRLGEIDGVLHVSGFGQSAEDVVTVDGDDYLIVPNVYRSGVTDYAAIKLD